jgi:hypothetical protein
MDHASNVMQVCTLRFGREMPKASNKATRAENGMRKIIFHDFSIAKNTIRFSVPNRNFGGMLKFVVNVKARLSLCPS